jgi:UDP-glucuronate 4-epimerase
MGVEVVGLDNLNDYYDVSLKQARLDRLLSRAGIPLPPARPRGPGRAWPLFAETRPATVVHLAAQAGVRYSLTNPHAYVDSNLVGTINVLEGCRRNEVGHLVFASSSSVYGGNTKVPFSVHDNVDHPLSLYAATKKANELMAHCYAHLYGLPCTGLRFSRCTDRGGGRTWRCSCSRRRSWRGVRSRCSTTAACRGTSRTSTTSWKGSSG